MQNTAIDPTAPGAPATVRSPGQAFAAAVAEAGAAARVDFPTTITASFPGFRQRPRLAVRSLFKVVTTDTTEPAYWLERRPGEGAAAVRDEALRPEAAFACHVERAALQPTSAWVQVPRPLLDDPAALASFIDFRLLVRLATAENQRLVLGRGGVLETAGVRRLPASGDPVSSLLAACDHVELMGGSADGVIMSTTDYFRHLAPRPDIVTSLAALGIRIARTRMIASGTAIVGDFFAGATIYDDGRSSIAFARPPEGTFAHAGLSVEAQVRTALAVHLPTHFFVASLV